MKQRYNGHEVFEVGVRLTGSGDDVSEALAALGQACPRGWQYMHGTTKRRNGGLVQAYGRLVKDREAR